MRVYAYFTTKMQNFMNVCVIIWKIHQSKNDKIQFLFPLLYIIVSFDDVELFNKLYS